jgi:protein SCO1
MSHGVEKAKAAGKGPAKKATKGAAAGSNAPKLPLLAIGAGFAVLFAGFVMMTSNQPPPPAASAIGGPFRLTTHTGGALGDKDLLGKPFLVFFGYTHCPDVCHTTLFEMSEILRALGPDAKVGALFVTLDPERDTPEILKDYLANFDQRIVGLSGAREALDPMLRAYHIYSKRVQSKTDDYSVDHTIAVYLMNKDGKFVAPFDVSKPPAEAARELARYL